MYHRSFVVLLILTVTSVAAIAQDADAKKNAEALTRAYSMTFVGDGGYLGIHTQEVTSENFSKFGLSEVRGVAVEKVLDNSPAASAGLMAGDVIVSVNGDQVTSVKKFMRLISEIAPDHKATLGVIRNGASRDVTATLGKRPGPIFSTGNFKFETPGTLATTEIPRIKELLESKKLEMAEMPKILTVPGVEGRAFAWTVGSARQIGVGVTPLTDQLAAHFGVNDGVLVNTVREDSPASRAGLRAGDIIVDVDSKAIKSSLDLIKAINEKKEGDIQVTFVRDRSRQTVMLTPEKSKDNGFVFDTGETAPAEPGKVRLAQPSTPMTAPIPTVFTRPGQII